MFQVSSLCDGLVPFSQQSMIMGPFATYDFRGILTDLLERKAITETLGDKNVGKMKMRSIYCGLCIICI